MCSSSLRLSKFYRLKKGLEWLGCCLNIDVVPRRVNAAIPGFIPRLELLKVIYKHSK